MSRRMSVAVWSDKWQRGVCPKCRAVDPASEPHDCAAHDCERDDWFVGMAESVVSAAGDPGASTTMVKLGVLLGVSRYPRVVEGKAS